MTPSNNYFTPTEDRWFLGVRGQRTQYWWYWCDWLFSVLMFSVTFCLSLKFCSWLTVLHQLNRSEQVKLSNNIIGMKEWSRAASSFYFVTKKMINKNKIRYGQYCHGLIMLDWAINAFLKISIKSSLDTK